MRQQKYDVSAYTEEFRGRVAKPSQTGKGRGKPIYNSPKATAAIAASYFPKSQFSAHDRRGLTIALLESAGLGDEIYKRFAPSASGE